MTGPERGSGSNVVAPAAAPRRLTVGMRRMLVVAAGLVLGTGLILMLLTRRTGEFFAWTIEPPLTAAFLGAGYLASVGFQLVAAREPLWAAARVAVTATLVFTTLTTIATLLHFDRFHTDSSEPGALLVTYAWIAVYVGVPPVMSVLLVRQLRGAGADPPRVAPFGAGFRVILGLQAAVMVTLGAALFVAPVATAELWPWQLTPLTARAVGAWLFGLGVAAAHSLAENDWARVRPTAAGVLGLGIFHLIALARFGGDVDWDAASAWIYAGFLVSVLAVGIYASWAAWRTARLQPPPLA